MTQVELSQDEIDLIKLLCKSVDGASEKAETEMNMLFEKLDTIKLPFHPTNADIWTAIVDASK